MPDSAKLANKEKIGAKKIPLIVWFHGVSAGGYMVINMLLEFPQKFAAAFSASEAYSDKNISDEDLEILKEVPLWITACKGDRIIDAEKFSMVTYERRKNAGAKDLHFSLYDKVSVGDEEYNPHCAWIYVLRDEVFDGELNLFDWLAAQKLQQ